MPILLPQNDARLPLLAEMLRENGAETHLLTRAEDARNADTLVSRYPFDELTREAMNFLPKKSCLLLLPVQPVNEELKRDYRVFSLMDDMLFVNENAVITAEGAVAAAMRDAPFALAGEKTAVIGYGRIGRALTEILIGIHARVTVVSRRENGRRGAMSRGAQACPPEEMNVCLPDARVIFVTTPERVLTMETLSGLSRQTLLYDLSGAPYGLDMAAANALRLNARREPSLPGRYAPESAAKAMYRAIVRIWNGGKME